MAEITIFLKFLMALALGALVGLERERFAKKDHKFQFGGIRTFMFISLLGAVAAYLSTQYFIWFIIPVFIALVFLIGLSYHSSVQLTKGENIGMTAEIVALLAFFFGAMCLSDNPLYGVVLAIIVTLFLYIKKRLHAFIQNVSKEEMYSTLVFAIIAFVILPFLPNETFGPLQVLNPYKIWLMVVFISGMSYVGYIAIKILGSNKGLGLTGLLGGIVSSTAVTMAFAAKSKKIRDEKLIKLFVFATLIANAVMFLRVLLEVYVVNKEILPLLILPMCSMGLVLMIGVAVIWWSHGKQRSDKTTHEIVEHDSPFRLGPAIKFGVLFGIVLVVVKIAQIHFGDAGLYVASLVSGFVDVDAITLSMADLAGGEITNKVAAIAITLAVISNTIIKFGYAALFGSKQFRNKLGVILVIAMIVGLLSILFI